MNLNEAKKILMNISNLTKAEQEAVKMIISALDKINDDEEWRDVIGYEKFYQVSNKGRVKSLHFKHEKILTATLNNVGYLLVTLCKHGTHKNVSIHSLVAKAFIPNPENKPEVNHKDGNKQNNNLENLEWATFSENTKHAFKIGAMKIKSGTENYQAKLTEEQVKYIRQNYKPNDKEFGMSALARKFNLTSSSVCLIIYHKTYKNVN